MAAEQRAAGGLAEAAIESRLDAIDQLLLGCLPRGERLAIVATLEEKLRSHWSSPEQLIPAQSGSPPFAETMPFPVPSRSLQGEILSTNLQSSTRSRLRRSKLALASGILGITAGALLFGTPVAYGLAAFFAELLDETFAIVTLVAYALVILLASTGAILAGLVALWRLRRRQEVGGRGWAITGLCTGPVPLGMTSLIALYIGIQTIDLSTYFGAGSDVSPPSASAATAEVPGQYTFVPGSNNSPPVVGQPLEPGAPLRLASEPTSTMPAAVELLAAPTTAPPPTIEKRPEPVNLPQSTEPPRDPTGSNGGLTE